MIPVSAAIAAPVMNLELLNDDVTVVTAYFNIGSFAKFAEWDQFTPARYRNWMKIFALIESPVIGFFDNDVDLQWFNNMRQNLTKKLTVLRKVDRNTASELTTLRYFQACQQWRI